MAADNPGILISFILYLLLMLGVGWYFYLRTKNLSDYVLGGRGLNTWVTSLSAQASDMSGWLLLGLPGAAYNSGYEVSWLAVGLALGTYANWKLVARRIRVYTEIAQDSITLPDFFENRFHDKSRVLRVVAALFILLFFMIYTSSGFVAGAKLFVTVFGWEYHTSLIIGVLVIISYTFLGGFSAVSWTDFFQGMLMFFAVILVPAIGLGMTGGWAGLKGEMSAANPNMLDAFTDTTGQRLSWIAIVSSMAWGLGYCGQPHILARFMAINKAENVRKSRLIAMIWVVIALGAAVLIGMVGLGFDANQVLTGGDAETVFMGLVNTIVHPAVAGVLLAAILAAVMSTADSQLLITSSSLTEDIYKAFINPKATDKQLVLLSRLAVVIVALIAVVIAWNPDSSVLSLVAYAWAGFGATFGPLVIMSLYWKRMNFTGALAGILVGGVTTVVWKEVLSEYGGIFQLYEIFPGFVLSLLAIYVGSILTKPPVVEIENEFVKFSEELNNPK
ncbi:MAG TPA: sodium/proline symporter PutP [Cytophagales bacterium]|nr:sodium/proline symporter PutP [Cytophagales bacterium]HAA19726.1 sodium/proline symporter PutP [Cytophagales bacterium]HAP61612.1 sodium/proline symporter PutP [Cytophagales bacterium]